MKEARAWMIVSGVCGFTLCIVANLTHFFVGLDVAAGLLQIAVNAFVFFTWRRGYLQYTGTAKKFAAIGTVWPLMMASITLYRVLLPALIRAIH